ncbi:MAG: AAA-like domain-containing protein [Gammaproteobacteria bacterium]
MSAEQWYYAFAYHLSKDLELAFDLSGWWDAHRLLPPVNRMLELFAEAVLARIEGRVVAFVDEIDTTIALSFSDDFFAAIRACYNARATAPEYRRLSFVLLGVASPTDLIKDVERTPFNLGRRIELADFGFAKARALATGLHTDAARGEALLRRVLHWTDGHPCAGRSTTHGTNSVPSVPSLEHTPASSRRPGAASRPRSGEPTRPGCFTRPPTPCALWVG